LTYTLFGELFFYYPDKKIHDILIKIIIVSSSHSFLTEGIF
jgi:hypothetical protein